MCCYNVGGGVKGQETKIRTGEVRQEEGAKTRGTKGSRINLDYAWMNYRGS